MPIAQILTYPDQRLRQKSLPVEIVDDNIRTLMNTMLDTMYQDNGVGLAAIQIGVAKRVLVLDLQKDDDKERAEGFYPLFIADPIILEKSEQTCLAKEGCLSLPEQEINIKRAQELKLEYIDYYNNKQTLFADGWLARALQHEMDHLDGKLLIDYLSKLKRENAVRKLNRIHKL